MKEPVNEAMSIKLDYELPEYPALESCYRRAPRRESHERGTYFFNYGNSFLKAVYDTGGTDAPFRETSNIKDRHWPRHQRRLRHGVRRLRTRRYHPENGDAVGYHDQRVTSELGAQ